jgi:hypothetical protein
VKVVKQTLLSSHFLVRWRNLGTSQDACDVRPFLVHCKYARREQPYRTQGRAAEFFASAPMGSRGGPVGSTTG